MSKESESEQKPAKKEIVYEDSELIKALKNYDVEPKENIKRKIDYFYSPYGAIDQNLKFMNFDERHEESKKVKFDKNHKPLHQYVNPSDRK